MPISAEDLQTRAHNGLNFFLKNNPIDQVAMQMPFLKAMSAKKKSMVGSKEHIVENIRTNYGSNGQWFSGSGAVTYNKRDSVRQASFSWFQFHDGLEITEDRLIANGITVTDAGTTTNMSGAERVQLVNLMEEQMEVLRLGSQEGFSRSIQLNGMGNVDQIVGLDGMLPLDNTTGTIGGIDRATAKYWRHGVYKDIEIANMSKTMDRAWRAASKHASGTPDLILAGQGFIEAYQAAAATQGVSGSVVRVTQTNGKGGVDHDLSTSGLFFKGIPIQYAPEFDDDFGGADTPEVPWTDRCYFINTNHMKLRPIDGNDFSTRKPPRDKSVYAIYIAMLWRGGLTMNMPSAHAVLALKKA